MGTLAAQIDANGISAPDFDDVNQQLRSGYWGIYGSDAVLDDDSQDGQLIAIFARAITDLNQMAIATYGAFSPASAQGAGLSSVIKINGLKRLNASNSQVVVTIVGQVGTPIINGIVGDNLNLGTQWALPPEVTIPDAGTIDVSATCITAGAIAAAPGSITVIKTPTLGWQSVTNAAAASLGNPVEQDATVRRRQAVSTANPSQTVKEGIYGALAALSGVGRLTIYENDGDDPDDDGLPGHTLAVVISGGDAMQIAQTIALKKTPGGGTAGTVSEVVLDSRGVPNTIRFYPLTVVPLTLHITIQPLAGYVSTTGDAIKAAVADFINGLSIGEKSYLNRLYSPANLNGDNASAATGKTQAQLDALSKTFNVTAILQSRDGNPPAAADVAIAFNEGANCPIPNITLTTL